MSKRKAKVKIWQGSSRLLGPGIFYSWTIEPSPPSALYFNAAPQGKPMFNPSCYIKDHQGDIIAGFRDAPDAVRFRAVYYPDELGEIIEANETTPTSSSAWNSVDISLPNNLHLYGDCIFGGIQYLVCCANRGTVATARWTDNRKLDGTVIWGWSFNSGQQSFNPTHWQPLPAYAP